MIFDKINFYSRKKYEFNCIFSKFNSASSSSDFQSYPLGRTSRTSKRCIVDLWGKVDWWNWFASSWSDSRPNRPLLNLWGPKKSTDVSILYYSPLGQYWLFSLGHQTFSPLFWWAYCDQALNSLDLLVTQMWPPTRRCSSIDCSLGGERQDFEALKMCTDLMSSTSLRSSSMFANWPNRWIDTSRFVWVCFGPNSNKSPKTEKKRCANRPRLCIDWTSRDSSQRQMWVSTRPIDFGSEFDLE